MDRYEMRDRKTGEIRKIESIEELIDLWYPDARSVARVLVYDLQQLGWLAEDAPYTKES